MSVDRIDRADVLDLLKPLWMTVPVTATRLLPRLDMIFDFAITEGDHTGNNALIGTASRKSLPKAEYGAQEEAPQGDDLCRGSGIRRRAPRAQRRALGLEFLILTALRTSEVIGATWDELSLEKGRPGRSRQSA